MSKHSLLLSAAAVALLSGSAFAADCPDNYPSDSTCFTSKSTDTALTSEKGNILIYYGGINSEDDENEYEGAIRVTASNKAAVTIGSNHFVYTNGAIANTESSGAVGIRVDLSADRDMTGLDLENYDQDIVSGAAIFIDKNGSLNLTDSGTDKTAIWLNGIHTLTGDIITRASSAISVKGDESTGILIDDHATLNGNITLDGAMTLYQTTTNSKDLSHMVGLRVDGTMVGDLRLSTNGSIAVIGQGSQGIVVGGGGIDGNVTIAGSLASLGVDANSLSRNSSYYYGNNTKSRIYAEGGTSLVINSDVTHGVQITGARYNGDTSSSTGLISTTGIDEAIRIEATTADLTIGVYQSRTLDTDTLQYTGAYAPESYNPGFGFYNRGAVTISSYNAVEDGETADVTGVLFKGGSHAVVIEGGFYNSGVVSATLSSKKKGSIANATAIQFDGAVYLSGTGGSAVDDYSYSCSPQGNGVPNCSLVSGSGRTDKGEGDQAAFVNASDTSSGTIAASVSGNGGGTATAIWIGAGANVSSLINSGSITATANTNSANIVSALEAYAIKDDSGTLTYIYNTGSISASATTLDSDAQVAHAIDLRGGNADNVTIVSEATASTSASISGDIYLGNGINQKVYVSGAGNSYTSNIVGDIHYGIGSGNLLSVGAFGSVVGQVTTTGSVDVDVFNNGVLYLTNVDQALNAGNLFVADGGSVAIGLSQSSALVDSGVIEASGAVNIKSGASLGVSYNSYLSTGDATGSYTASDYSGADYVLISGQAGNISVEDIETYSSKIATPLSNHGSLPFLFKEASLLYVDAGGNTTTNAALAEKLVLHVQMKSAVDMGLSGYAKTMFAHANVALSQDDILGAAMISGIHADAGDLTAVGTSKQAQAAYNSFAPDVSGGTRAIAVAITDQATGVVAARQRTLRMYARSSGGMTLWGQEFVQMIKTPGQGEQQVDKSYAKNGFKDHGFGFVLGLDSGSAREGWYGGALTFYNGDVNETGRTAHENQLWVLATGYSTWRGKGFFFDAKIDAGYGHIKGTRNIILKTGTGSSEVAYVRTAQNSHAAMLISGGVTGGTTFTYGALTMMPQVSLDALVLRENGYTEESPTKVNYSGSGMYGDGFNLRVEPYFAQSLRSFIGGALRYDINLWGVYLQPELRLGYRYDFLAQPVKVKAAFRDVEYRTAGNQVGDWFRLTGPDPTSGSFVAGTSLGATTRDWSINMHFDLVRGGDGSLQETGTINLVGRL